MTKQLGSDALAALAVAGLLSLAARLPAQCADWAAGVGVPGVDGTVYAMARWDPDGPGPQAEWIVLGGQFSLADDSLAANVVAYDPTNGAFVPLAGGLDGTVYALGVDAGGGLLAGGSFSSTAAAPFPALGRLARWNGSTWSAEANVAGTVRAMLVEPNGDLVLGGQFGSVSGVAANGVARRTAGVWSPLGSGTSQVVRALARLPGGQIVAGGQFPTIGGNSIPYLARWDGSGWSAFGGSPDGIVTSLLSTSSGDLLVGGLFGHVAGAAASNIARWNGAAWSALGSGTNGVVASLSELANGDVYAGGAFSSAGGAPAGNLARWNGTTWSQPGGGATSPVNALLATAGGALYVGGGFLIQGQPSAVGVSRFQGTWSPLTSSPATGGPIRVLHVDLAGVVYAAGATNVIGGTGIATIARRDAGVWSPVGTYLDGIVHAIVALPNGDVVAAGEFTHAGGVAAARIARWDGSAWSPLGAGSSTTVRAMALLPNGDLVADGIFQIAGTFVIGVARWDGTQWSALPPGVGALAMHVAANGDLLVGGTANGVPAVLRFDGVAWTQLGGAMGGNVLAVTELPDGSVVAGGLFHTAVGGPADYIARWNGTAWLPMPGGPSYFVDDLAVLPGGDLIAAGRFLVEGRILRWNGSAWSALGAGLGNSPQALAVSPAGELLVGGDFVTADGAPAAYLTSYRSLCPATVASVGAGCAGSGGVASYAATSLPWLGTTFRAHGSGLPALAFAITVTGLSPTSLQLGSLVQPSPPSCALLVAPELLDLNIATAGAVDTVLAIPVAPAFLGARVHQQLVALELDPSLQFVEWTSSNALVATLGDF